jgi:hypothetical protein
MKMKMIPAPTVVRLRVVLVVVVNFHIVMEISVELVAMDQIGQVAIPMLDVDVIQGDVFL